MLWEAIERKAWKFVSESKSLSSLSIDSLLSQLDFLQNLNLKIMKIIGACNVLTDV